MENEYPKYQRHMPEETKMKISQKMTGVPKSEEHRAHISQAIKATWAKVPNEEE